MIDNFFYTVRLTAGVPFAAPYGGTFFALWDTGAVRSVSLQFVAQGQTGQKISGMTSGFQVEANFEQVIFTADADTTVQFFASAKPLKLGTKDGQQVKVLADTPLPVNFAGTVAPVLGEIKNGNDNAVPIQTQQLKKIVDIESITLASANTKMLVSADATLKRLRIRNNNVSAIIAIGGENVTLENCPIILQPDDIYIEEDAAGANWYAISNETNANIQLQGVK
jgi:predicted nuclease of predicted toxin-antitoxin system